MKRALALVVLLASCRRDPIIMSERNVRAPAPVQTAPFRVLRPHRPAVKRSYGDAAIDAMLDRVRGMGVGGNAVGLAAQESEFHVAATKLTKADRALFTWLLADDDPTLRALGLFGLAKLRESEPVVQHLCDRDSVLVCPGGCMCTQKTVGQIARKLLDDPGWLETSDDHAPLTDEPSRKELELRLRASDACGMEHPSSPTTASWTLAELRARAPKLPDWMLVKAAARSGADVASLSGVLDDGTVSNDARLAAASGLTLTSDARAEAALSRNAAFLDGVRSGLSAELLETVRARRKMETLMAPIDAAKTWMETEKLAANAIAVAKIEHPLVVGRLVTPVSYGARDKDVAAARIATLLRLAERLAEHRSCWDAYRNVAYELEDALADDRLREAMTKEPFAAFERNVRAEAAQLDGTCW